MSMSRTLVERRIAERIKAARIQRDVTQSTLGQKIGISPQQVQKYESGKDKIRASDLYVISHVLQIDISRFFDDEIVKQTSENPVDDDDLRRGDGKIARSRDVRALRATSLIFEDHIRLKLIALLEAIVCTSRHVAATGSTEADGRSS